MRRAPRLILAVAATAGLSCRPPAEKPRDPDDLPLLGTKPFSLLPKPDFTFTDTRGRPYDFRKETDGKIALLYFGYTYCPDVCPLEMATLGAALKEVDAAVRGRVQVVFVTVDPARDTAERLSSWLASFDTTFVGLRGSRTAVDSVLAVYGFPPTKTESVGDGYVVSHPGLVYAFTPDDHGRAMYGSETTKATWVHDLNLIAGHPWVAADSTPGAASARAGAAGGIRVLDAYAPEPAAGGSMAVYLTLLNTGGTADTLVGLAANLAGRASLHETRHMEGMEHMSPVSAIALPPGDTVRLEPGGRHGMLEELSSTPRAGDTLQVILRFALAGALVVPTRVVRYADLVR
jgi:protein SCO1